MTLELHGFVYLHPMSAVLADQLERNFNVGFFVLLHSVTANPDALTGFWWNVWREAGFLTEKLTWENGVGESDD